jgi:uncharacterized damage-inducible protein DinB
MTPADLGLLFDYHYWATHRMLEAAARVTPEQLGATSTVSHGSLHRLLLHALTAEYAWRTMCERGQEVPGLDAQEFATVPAIAARWREEEAAMREFLEPLSKADLLRVVSYNNNQGEPRQRVLWHCLFHVVNHATHTRGQAVSLLREFGHSPGNVDFTYWLGEVEAGRRG